MVLNENDVRMGLFFTRVLLFKKLIIRKPDLLRHRGLYIHFEVEKTSIFLCLKVSRECVQRL